MSISPGDTELGGARRDFPSTCWSRFIGDVPTSEEQRESAAEELAKHYWKPIYAYVRATWAKSNEDAKDLTQEFFIWMIETDFLGRADPARGRFRAFVKVALKHWLTSDDRKTRRLKRGGDHTVVALEAAMGNLAGVGVVDPRGRAPDEILDETWKNELLVRAATMLEETLRREGKEVYFKVFQDYHLGPGEGVIHRDVAAKYGISVTDVGNYLQNAKKRYRDILKDLVGETVQGERELGEEWSFLFGGESRMSQPAAWNLRKLQDVAAEPVALPELVLPATLGKYVLDREIARGAMGVVYRADDTDLRRTVAVKVLRSEVGDVVKQRFRREAQATARLAHPNVIKVFDAGEQDGRMYLVMELVEGRSLREVLTGGLVQVRPMVDLLRRAALGVSAAHDAGIVHRDLKPANILVAESGEPKVGDFGLAHWVDAEAALTKTGTPLGTPLYMAPEQVRGSAADITPATDVYALGAILYEILTGRPPHIGENVMEIYSKIVGHDALPPRRLNPKTGREIETICLKAIEADPLRRYRNAKEFAEDLRRHLDGESIQARPPGALSLGVKWTRRHRTSAAVALVMILALASFAAWRVSDAARRREERKREVDGLIALGLASAARVKALDSDIAALQKRRRELAESIQSFDDEERKRPLWRVEADLASAGQARDGAVAETALHLGSALQLDPAAPVAKSRLAALFAGEFERAERDRDAGAMEISRRWVERYDERREFLPLLMKAGVLKVESHPAGASVECFRLEEGADRRLVPLEGIPSGPCPLEAELSAGSYLLVLKKEGLRDVRCPVLVERGKTQSLRVNLYPGEVIGAGFVLVPGGPFIRGGDRDAYVGFERGEETVGDFCIGRFEVTVAEYRAFLYDLTASGRDPEAVSRLPRDSRSKPLSVLGDDFPVLGVSWDDADAYCRWLSGRSGIVHRLPTEAQWEKAARGVDGRFFPWGNHFDWSFTKGSESSEGPARPEAVGAFPKDESPYGVRDLAGSAQEWCADAFGPSPSKRAIRGGAWYAPAPAVFRAASRLNAEKDTVTNLRGFRVVKEIVH